MPALRAMNDTYVNEGAEAEASTRGRRLTPYTKRGGFHLEPEKEMTQTSGSLEVSVTVEATNDRRTVVRVEINAGA